MTKKCFNGTKVGDTVHIISIPHNYFGTATVENISKDYGYTIFKLINRYGMSFRSTVQPKKLRNSAITIGQYFFMTTSKTAYKKEIRKKLLGINSIYRKHIKEIRMKTTKYVTS